MLAIPFFPIILGSCNPETGTEEGAADDADEPAVIENAVIEEAVIDKAVIDEKVQSGAPTVTE